LAVRKLVPVLVVFAAVYFGAHYFERGGVPLSAPAAPAAGAGRDASGPTGVSSLAPAPARDAIASAFAEHRSGIEVSGQGVVTRILSDDRSGSPHQRFILRLPSGQTLLIAHNIALAERIPSLRTGDVVQFKGEYEWNAQGGVVHWTHDDPRGRHDAGWLEHDGRTYH
jgi:Protein of unknown function (DUF3465)